MKYLTDIFAMLAGMDLFPDSVKRLNRAVLHFNAAQAEITKFIQPDGHSVVIEMNEEWTEGVAKTRLPSVPENDIALELGEFFYQLRAALDALIYQASIYSEGASPPSNEEKVEFPICIDEGKFNRNAVNKAPFPKELRDWLLSIQPYIAHDPRHPCHSLSRYLQILHDCARIDRHRRLHVAGVASFDVGTEFKTSPNVIVYGIEAVDGKILQDEAVFLRFKVPKSISTDPKKIELKSKFRLQIAVSDLPIPEGSDTGKELRRIIDAVALVIGFFKECHSEETGSREAG